MVLKGDLTVSTESVERLSVLEGEKEGSGSIPARQTAGKTIGGRVLLRLNAKVWKLSWLHGESESRNHIFERSSGVKKVKVTSLRESAQ